MTQSLLSLLAVGYIFIVGFVFLVMIIQLLSFYAAGKMMGSINDEFMSAFTLFGALFVLGMASTLVNAILSIFLTGGKIPALLAFVIYLVAMVYTIIRVYDLSIGKAILHLIVSFVMTMVISGLIVYGGIKLFPNIQNSLGSAIMSNTNVDQAHLETASDIRSDSETGTDDTLDTTTETGNAVTGTEPTTTAPSGPKLPGSPAGSHAYCDPFTRCASPEEACFAETCQTKPEIEGQFEATTNCDTYPCENCAKPDDTLFFKAFTYGTVDIVYCAECDPSPASMFACKEGFTCKDDKCVAN